MRLLKGARHTNGSSSLALILSPADSRASKTSGKGSGSGGRWMVVGDYIWPMAL